MLRGKFQRMVFLTATPFQLGHQELIHVLRSFDAIRWTNANAPGCSSADFQQRIGDLETALDENRRAGRNLDRLWGKLRAAALGECSVEDWWQRVEMAPTDDWERRLADAVTHCQRTRQEAEVLLRPWVIRHNRPQNLAERPGQTTQPRRQGIYGREIVSDPATPAAECQGLPIDKASTLPFLLTARVQGELAQLSAAGPTLRKGFHRRTKHSTIRERSKGRRGTSMTTAWLLSQPFRRSYLTPCSCQLNGTNRGLLPSFHLGTVRQPNDLRIPRFPRP